MSQADASTHASHTPHPKPHAFVDTAIVGAGIAGTWVARQLQDAGYRVLVIEQSGWGAGQTGVSQGIIHGGLKYALLGDASPPNSEFRDMPQRWRACLNGTDSVDLQGVRVMSDGFYLFAGPGMVNRGRTFAAARASFGNVDAVEQTAWPAALQGLKGSVYRIDDLVLDIPSLLGALNKNLLTRTRKHTLQAQDISADEDGYNLSLGGERIHCRYLINCSGAGSDALIKGLGINDLPMQLRPLHQVVVKPRHQQVLFAHCLTGITRNEPRLTITSHRSNNATLGTPAPGSDSDDCLWYLGGQLATEGVQRSPAAQIDHARDELQACLPWLDWAEADFDTLRVDRAEASPELAAAGQSVAAQRERFIQCFPTKLTLAPVLGDQVLRCLQAPAAQGPDLSLEGPQLAASSREFEPLRQRANGLQPE
ncbi:MAG: FAD-dependent oxidoreductase [Pseudomonadota bacterium]